MSALENAKTMSSEELLEKIAALELQEYGLVKGSLAERFAEAKQECAEEQKEPGAVAALNNADVDGVLLKLLKKEPERIMEGLSIAAYIMETDRKTLNIPEYAQALTEDGAVKAAAEKYGVKLELGIVNKRASKGSILIHIAAAKNLADAMEDENNENKQESGIYVSVNGKELQKVSPDTKIADVLASESVSVEGVKALQIGYRYYLPEAAEMTVGEAGIENGVLRTLSEKDCIVSETEKKLTEYRKQSCGKCVFCREGLIQLHYMHKEIKEGRGKAEYPELTKEIGEAMTYSTPCTMGQVSSKLALTGTELFEKEYQEHIKKKKCPAGVCFSSETIYIDPKLCDGCGECMDVCPKDCIEGKSGYIHMIDDMDCDKCGKCLEVCAAGAVMKTAGKLPKLPNRLTKVGRFKKR